MRTGWDRPGSSRHQLVIPTRAWICKTASWPPAKLESLIPDVLLLCEHPHVITLGRNGKHEHLLASEPLLRQMGVEFHETNRGGDITYHGPGQLVAYPILNLHEIRRDLAGTCANSKKP